MTGIEAADAVVEVGPGRGRLTRAIAAVARRTVALEVDRGLFRLLVEQELGAGVELRHQDVMKADLGGLARELGAPVVLIGNLPYRIAGRLVGSLLGPRTPFRRWGFMLQREVADRVLAEPGTRAYGPLAVWTTIWAEARRVLSLSPEDFDPRPRVHSSFVVFDPASNAPEVASPPALRELVRCAFQHRRKTLRAAFRGRIPEAERALEQARIDPGSRPERLSPGDFVELANAVSQARPDS